MRNGVVGLAGTSAAGDQRLRWRRNRCHRRRGRRFDAPGADHTRSADHCATSGASATIPDGTYSRVVVREDAIAAGFDPELVDKYLEADGELPMAIKVAGDRWTHFVTTDSGIAEIGDARTASYDDDGHWVTVSESEELPALSRCSTTMSDAAVVASRSKDTASATMNIIIIEAYEQRP